MPEGIRADIAINQASAQLSSGVEALRVALCGQEMTFETASLWSAFYTLEGAAALVEALTLSFDRTTPDEAAQEGGA